MLSSNTVHAVVPLMITCGMYNNAGKFVKDWGVPTKSGVSGGLLTIIPNLGAVINFSPKIDEVGNSVKGIAIIKHLNGLYKNFNLFQKD